MSFRIEKSENRQTVILSVQGGFDLTSGFALWQYCQPEQHYYQRYVFNLEGVSELQDSGLGWLRMFLKWAQTTGVRVYLTNVRAELMQNLTAAGIETKSATLPEKEAAELAGSIVSSAVGVNEKSDLAGL